MQVNFYNTLTRSLTPFTPVEPGVVRMYHCGPTVYDFAHIGNFRSFLLADLLRRFFEFTANRVEQVMNITDVGHMTDDALADGGGQDKMELAAERLKAAKKSGTADVENPNDPYQIAAYFTQAFLEDARLLGMRIADEESKQMPRATDHVNDMIALIKRLITSNHAYATDSGAVYYDVTSFPDYGKLSGNTLERLREGAGGRIDQSNQQGKRNPADFLLWKQDDSHIMKWPSPWGTGYPGWHIECSAMAMAVLKTETLDIHTGGEDNIFPHHECEIAQSTGATGKPFANTWLHARHLMVEGEKMSKSKGNFYTVRDLLAKGVDPAALRFELIKTHYRSNANFTQKGLEDSTRMVRRLRDFAGDPAPTDQPPTATDTPVEQAFTAALAEDLNISAALGELNKWINATPSPTDADRATLRRIDSVLGILDSRTPATPSSTATSDSPDSLSDDQIESKCQQIHQARTNKDFATSDAIRDQLIAAGIEVQISREGVTWRRKVQL